MLVMHLAADRPGGGVAQRIMGLLHLSFSCINNIFMSFKGQRKKSVFLLDTQITTLISIQQFAFLLSFFLDAFSLVLSFCFFNVRSATCFHGQDYLQWGWQSALLQKNLWSSAVSPAKALFGLQTGIAQVTSSILSSPKYSMNLWRSHLAPNQAGERWICTWVAERP